MSIKALHLADIHYSKERKDLILSALAVVKETIKKEGPDVLVIAGDIFDAAVLNTENAGFADFIQAMKGLGDLCPLAIVAGTPSHDISGSLEIFKTLNTEHGITVLEPGQAYFLVSSENPFDGSRTIIIDEHQKKRNEEAIAVLLGMPEPMRSFLLADTSAGKDETEEAIRGALHRICFQLAVKRREYPGLPCAFVYHGDIAGSSLQNDQTIERGTGIAITIDDLADIGADYYALGHIHKPQRVGNLPAYYAGSLIPKNFGESHKAGFNLVTFDVGKYNIERIDLPYPQNLKIEIKSMRAFKAFSREAQEISGKKVWLEISCTKEERALIDAEKELSDLIEAGAVPGSRVTLSDIPVETVRAAEITEVNTPAKKFEVWAENSAVEFSGSHLEKIEALDAEITKGAAKIGGEWEIVSLRLKGAVGIMKGIKKEEIAVNFDNYDSGLIALVGANGKGKTTLIENCHPYPQLLTRKGKLQDHFYLKDSFREVVYRNRADGSLRKFLIQIDGQNKSGSCKYFIFKQSAGLAGAEWEPFPGVDGNLKPYEEALGSIFGPIELFQRTAFITQRPTKNLPDLTDATAGEKKSLFVALAGIDYLQNFADAAAEKVKLESAKTHDAEIKMQVLQAAIEKKPREEQELKDADAALTIKKAELAEVTEQGRTAKTDVERLREEWNAEQIRQRQENEAKAAVDTANAEIRNLSLDIDILAEAAGNKPRYEKDVSEYEALRNVIDGENAKKQKVTEANLKKQQDYMKIRAAYDENVRSVEAERDNLCGQRNDRERMVTDAENNVRLAEKDEEVERNRLTRPLTDWKAEVDRLILTAKSRIELYERDAAEITEDCPTCGQKLPEAKLAELKARRGEYVQKIEAEKAAIESMNAELADIESNTREAIRQAAGRRDTKIAREQAEIQKQNNMIAEIDKRIEELGRQISELAFDEPEEPEDDPFDGTALQAAVAKQRRIDIEQTRAALAKAQEAAVRIDGLKKQAAEKTALLKDREAAYAKIRQKPEVGAKIKADLDAAAVRHTELSEQYASAKSEIARTEAVIEALRKSLTDIAEREKEYSVLNRGSLRAALEGREWELISKAFGKDGIQALELDALAPGISDTANRILESAYGDRFTVAIETTRIGGAGKKTKQIEDFLIFVTDSEDGERRLLDNLSGGESVWVKRAIYDAFSVIRKRNTGFSFVTAFQDETDGALDADAKVLYTRMLEAAHFENKMRHTVIITHSDSVKASIPQHIDMGML